jgi:hypothetical protein
MTPLDQSDRVRRMDLGVLAFIRIAVAVFAVVAPCLGLLWYGITHQIELMNLQSEKEIAQIYVTKEAFSESKQVIANQMQQLQDSQRQIAALLNSIAEHVADVERERAYTKGKMR